MKRKFWHGIARRSPKANKVMLKHKSIYVLPTRQGLLFILVLVLMWILGTNYENNLILAVTFLLISMLIVSILHTYRNLSGLRFQPLHARSVLAGEQAEFAILAVSSSGRASSARYENIHVGLDGETVITFDLVDEKEHTFSLATHSHKRGWLEPGRILVKTYYPLGLMRAWSWIELDMRALIYPKPIACEEPPLAQLSEQHGEIVARDNTEDFYGFTPYRAGAPLSLVAWKQYARGAGLHLKEYVGYQSQDVWLDWHALKGLDTEARLSRLCYWVLQLGKTPGLYGLRLPRQIIDLGTGSKHQETLLRALALYNDSAAVGDSYHGKH
jgi:uncharacterized protein (DUF58 family)